MEKEDFVEKYYFVFLGIVAEAMRENPKGSEAGISLDLKIKRIKSELAKAWHDMNPVTLPSRDRK